MKVIILSLFSTVMKTAINFPVLVFSVPLGIVGLSMNYIM